MSDYVTHAAAPPPPPAAVEAPPPTEVVPAVDDGLADLRRYWKQGEWLALIADDGPRGNVARGAVALWWAAELGLSPLAARLIIVGKDGRIQVGAELLRALAHREGYRVIREGSTDAECTAVLTRAEDGSEVGRYTYRIEQAERAGLLTKTAWRAYPEDMLWARASARLVKDYLPNVATGLEDSEGYTSAFRDDDLEFVGEVDHVAGADDGGYLPDDDIPM